MVTEVRSSLPPASMPVAPPADAAKPAEKAPEPAATFEPVLPKKTDFKVDPQQMRQNLEQAISHLNDLMRDGGRGLNFSMDPALSRPVVYVKNAETGEVVRQIPNEVVVRVAHSIEELKGLLHNSSA